MKRVNSVLIGKDIDRTASLVITPTASQNLVEGEVFVADKNKALLAAGSTIADTDHIYIGVGTGTTYTYTNPAGTSVTARKIKWSAPIEGKNIKSYKGVSADSGPVERKCTINIDAASSFAPVVGTEYVVRLVFTNVTEHPGQFVQDYRVTAATTTVGDLTDALVSVINNYKPSLVTASNVSDDLVIVAKDVSPSESTAIDEYRQVQFYAFLDASTTTGWDDVVVTYNTNPDPGNGNPKLVRDKEKHSLGYEGVTNQWKFPVVKPDLAVDMDAWYDSIVIEHDQSYVSADNDYIKETSHTTEIYTPAGALQTADLLGVLNSWVVSAGKSAITV